MSLLLAAPLWPLVLPWVCGVVGSLLVFLGLNGHLPLLRLLARIGGRRRRRETAEATSHEERAPTAGARETLDPERREQVLRELQVERLAKLKAAEEAETAAEASAQAEELQRFQTLQQLLQTARQTHARAEELPAVAAEFEDPSPLIPEGLADQVQRLRRLSGSNAVRNQRRQDCLRELLRTAERLLDLLASSGDPATRPEIQRSWVEDMARLIELEADLLGRNDTRTKDNESSLLASGTDARSGGDPADPGGLPAEHAEVSSPGGGDVGDSRAASDPLV